MKLPLATLTALISISTAYSKELSQDLFSFMDGDVATSSLPAQNVQKQDKNLVSFDGEALILNAALSHQEFADRVFDVNQVQTHRVSSLPSGYNVGVRGSFGFYVRDIDWNIQAVGFHFHDSKSQSQSRGTSDSFIFYPTYSSNLNSDPTTTALYDKIKGRFEINLNMGDLILSKNLVMQKHFGMSLDAGFRYYHNTQQFVISNLDPEVIVALGENKIQYSDTLGAYGLVFRAHNYFKFTKSFFVDLSLAGSGVYGEEKMENLAASNPLTPVSVAGTSFTQYNPKILPIIEFEAKFSYAQKTKDESLSYEITAGYFLMDLVNSFSGIKIAFDGNSAVQTTSRFTSDTLLQGATVGAKLSF